MIGLDTNILVRFIVKDDVAQFQKTVAFLEKFTGVSDSLFVSHIVICELAWVLKRGYKYRKNEILEVLSLLLNLPEIVLEDRKIVVKATELYTAGQADFSDYLIMNINSKHNCSHTVSFDTHVDSTEWVVSF